MGAIDNPVPGNLEDWMREIEKKIARLERRGASVVTATVTGEGQPLRVPSPTSATPEVPTAAPASAPTLSATGSQHGITVVASGEVAPTTTLDYYLDDVLVHSGHETVLFWATDANGDPMIEETLYTFYVVARNDIGGVASDPVSAKLNDAVSDEYIVGKLTAGGILTGLLEVGDIKLDPNVGIVAPRSDGAGTTVISTTAAPNKFVGGIEADWLTVLGTAVLQGDTTVYGLVEYASGTNAPGVQPNVLHSWLDPDVRLDLDIGTAIPYGFYDDGTSWLTIQALTGTTYQVRSIDKATGVDTALFNLPSNFYATGGITKGFRSVADGTCFFVLGSDKSRSDRWFVYVYDATWNKIDEWEFFRYNANLKKPHIGYWGGDVTVAWWNTTSTGTVSLLVREFAPDTGTIDATTTLVGAPDGPTDITGFCTSFADFGGGVDYWILAQYSRVLVYTPGGVRHTELEWASANNETIRGLDYNDEADRFESLSNLNFGRVWHYSPVVEDATETYTHTKVKVTEGYETEAGPGLAFLHEARQWAYVETDPPGGLADAVNIYIDDHLQNAAPLAGPYGMYVGAADTLGDPAPTASTFPILATPGVTRSQAVDAAGDHIWQFEGDGSWNAGDLQGETTGRTNVTREVAHSETVTTAATLATTDPETQRLATTWTGRTGQRYRVYALVNIRNNTAGGRATARLRWDFDNVGADGTVFQTTQIDFPTASTNTTRLIIGEFTYIEADNTDISVKLTIQSTNGSTTPDAATFGPTRLIVDAVATP